MLTLQSQTAMVPWPSGEATVCKTVYSSSILLGTSKRRRIRAGAFFGTFHTGLIATLRKEISIKGAESVGGRPAASASTCESAVRYSWRGCGRLTATSRLCSRYKKAGDRPVLIRPLRWAVPGGGAVAMGCVVRRKPNCGAPGGCKKSHSRASGFL